MKHYEDHTIEYSWRHVGFYSALLIAVVTAVMFSIAIFTPPLSGPLCKSGCYEYPYSDIASRYPRDYYWMYPALLLNILFVPFIASIHQYAHKSKKIYSLSALLFTVIASSVLFIDYYVQLTVIQPSLLKGEADGIALLTQYNPHGLFIALEEVGYGMMSLALFCTVPVFSKDTRLEKAIRTTHFACFFLTVLALITVSTLYGINREYRFEIAVITINCLTLMISGILLSRLFKRIKVEQLATS